MEDCGYRTFPACRLVRIRMSATSAALLHRYLAQVGAAPLVYVPDRIRFVDSLPENSVGKVDRKALRRQLG